MLLIKFSRIPEKKKTDEWLTGLVCLQLHSDLFVLFVLLLFFIWQIQRERERVSERERFFFFDFFAHIYQFPTPYIPSFFFFQRKKNRKWAFEVWGFPFWFWVYDVPWIYTQGYNWSFLFLFFTEKRARWVVVLDFFFFFLSFLIFFSTFVLRNENL